jgi:hypothetical protein
MMNCKVFGSKRSWPNFRYYLDICLQGLKKTMKILMCIKNRCQHDVATRITFAVLAHLYCRWVRGEIPRAAETNVALWPLPQAYGVVTPAAHNWAPLSTSFLALSSYGNRQCITEREYAQPCRRFVTWIPNIIWDGTCVCQYSLHECTELKRKFTEEFTCGGTSS